MKSLPERSNIEHLRRQVKELLRDYRRNEPAALERFRSWLPAGRGKDDASLSAMQLQLLDAQSCIAREYGFESWADLKARIEWQQASTKDLAAVRLHWLQLVYGGPIAAGNNFFGRPLLAAKLLAERPELGRIDTFVTGMRRCVRLLLDAGANPDQSIGNRIAPASRSSDPMRRSRCRRCSVRHSCASCRFSLRQAFTSATVASDWYKLFLYRPQIANAPNPREPASATTRHSPPTSRSNPCAGTLSHSGRLAAS